MEATMSIEKIRPILNGTFTIRNRKTGEYRTFKIHTQPEGGFCAGRRIVSVLVGPDNVSNYGGFAFVNDAGDGIDVWHSKRRREENDNKPTAYEWFGWMLADLLAHDGSRFGDRYDVLETRRCLICNRKLTTPESIERGIGPICEGRM